MPRCIRLEYAGDFHLDIVPAIPDPECGPGDTCLLIPDREKKIWRPSNPKGYARWFEAQTVKLTRFSAKEGIEPLPVLVSAYVKAPLKLAVQLLKRWRDVAFQGREKLAPSSIILTTLAAYLYRGEAHPTDALLTILDGIYTWSNREEIRLKNPSNDREWLTDRWQETPGMYEAFLEGIYDLRIRWHKLVEHGRFPDLVGELKDLFGEAPVVRAFKIFAERRGEARTNGNLFTDRATGIVTLVPAQSSVKVKDHAFHGS
jgi:hypothetical protein